MYISISFLTDCCIFFFSSPISGISTRRVAFTTTAGATHLSASWVNSPSLLFFDLHSSLLQIRSHVLAEICIAQADIWQVCMCFTV